MSSREGTDNPRTGQLMRVDIFNERGDEIVAVRTISRLTCGWNEYAAWWGTIRLHGTTRIVSQATEESSWRLEPAMAPKIEAESIAMLGDAR